MVISLLGPDLRVGTVAAAWLIWAAVCFLSERFLSVLEELQTLSAAVMSSSEDSEEEEEEEDAAQDDGQPVHFC